MNSLTMFGLFTVTAMLVTYWMEHRSPWFILALSAPWLLGAAYGFLQRACPSGWLKPFGSGSVAPVVAGKMEVE
ncbi:MAG TPA: hypothetical protein VKV15_07320 [Bryobacteraceae bacterium]|nr:hypothetical protein [Bryobacteraceae bacterium]